jgi:2,5-diamino-6-(ribosylamino)-4(3H)-pyrimidinone 5'-phosphate reductase
MNRPFVLVNMAMTVDGKITSAAREYPRLTSRYDRDQMDRLRAGVDAVLVGASTLRADRPLLHVRSPEIAAERAQRGKPGGLLKIAVSRSLDIPADHPFFDDPDGGGLLLATVLEAPVERSRALEGRAEIWRLGSSQVDLHELLARLADRGIERLLVEGGGEMNWAFAEADLVDELHVTLAPSLLGGRDAPTILDGGGFAMPKRLRLRLEQVHREDDELYLRYAVLREADPA